MAVYTNELNHPTLCRTQQEEFPHDEHRFIVEPDGIFDPSTGKVSKADMIWGSTIIPEYQLFIINPDLENIPPLTKLQYRWFIFKEQIARAIIWLSNKIGDNNV